MQVTKMKILDEYPPNYRDIVDALGDVTGAVFCYGDTIYNPFAIEILPDIEIHEQVHSKQQGDAVNMWYHRYLTDAHFRLAQEIEAYGEQYNFIKKLMGGSLLKWRLDQMAQALSGKEYGNIISYGEAISKIRNYGKY